MTTPGTWPPARTGLSATEYGLTPDALRLRHDEHGAAHIYLDADGDMTIRIQLEQDWNPPEQHAAALERDRQGLLRLAGLATQLAEEIGQIQSGEAGQ